MKNKKFYITVAIPYVNAKPHLGHILEWFQADTFARFYRKMGFDVAFTSGTDENSLKNVSAAEKSNQVKSVQEWLDKYSDIFRQTFKTFDISLTHFMRTSDKQKHIKGVYKLWNLAKQNGDIYKKTYEGLYCEGCEAFYKQDELIDGKCPYHKKEPTKVKEENYFFRLSKYQDKIKQVIQEDIVKIESKKYKNEVLQFINKGLTDFSISRPQERGKGLIGLPVPDDPSQVIYVWFDALTVYLSAIGFGYDDKQYEKYWPADMHIIGKDISKFHAIYWIGMLLSAGLPLPKKIYIHGFITLNGQKMSKTLGNIIDPFELIQKYPIEALRLYMLSQIPQHNDGDFSYDKFENFYTGYLANGLGNLVSRISTLAFKFNINTDKTDYEFDKKFISLIKDKGDLTGAISYIWDIIQKTDKFLTNTKPWLKQENYEQNIKYAIQSIRKIAFHLYPFMPKTATKIEEHFKKEKIEKIAPLFPRL